MKVIVVVLILIQISLIVTNPNNTIESKQKESKGIGKNLSQQSRLGVMGWIKNVVGRAKDAVKVKSFLDVGKTYAKTAFNFAGEKAKSIKDVPKIVKSVKTLTGFLKK